MSTRNIKIKHYGIVKPNGHVSLDDTKLFMKEARQHAGKRVYLTLTRYRQGRTSGQPWEESNQNGYYWGVVIPILSTELGIFPEDIHNNLRRMFLRIGGTDEMPIMRSTADLDKAEWEDYMTDIRTWASTADEEHSIYIPLPNETEWSK